MRQISNTNKSGIFKCIGIFMGGALLYLAAVLPFLLRHDGIFFYYGDYNVQQVPFYILAHRAVREGRFFWTPFIDLGSSMGGSMSFYLWGSPFFWLTIPFEEHVVPYLMPFLMALRCGTASLTSYLYIRRHVRDRFWAVIGALLYTFSGFGAVNIVFQHFHDVIAFFPLYLISFDDMIQRGRYTGFALMTALMSIVNYYFFFGEVVFIILYYLVRYVPRISRRACAVQAVRGIMAGAAGLMLSAFFLVQSLGGLMGNTRVDDVISGYGLLIYEDSAAPLAIIKSAFMVPDIIAKPTLFSGDSIKNSSPALFIPCFSMAGVIAFIRAGRHSWKRKMIILCAAMAMVPVLNSSFSAFNRNYYSRWYYMPLLIMSCMTAQVLDKKRFRDLRRGTVICVTAAAAITAFAAYPFQEEGERRWFGIADNPELLKTEILATGLQLIALLFLVYVLPAIHIKGKAVKGIYLIAAAACCLITTISVLDNGSSLIARTGGVKWKQQMLETRPTLSDTNTFSRVETESTSTNYEMVWGYPTIHCFESTVNPSIFSFYREIGMIRTVESTLPVERIGARALLSTRYYIENTLVKPKETIEDKGGLYGYEETDRNSGYRIFENRNFIPMGFTFRHFITQSNYDAVSSKEARDRLLVRDLILSEEQRELYGDMMEEDRNITAEAMSDQMFDAECRLRAASACSEFTFTKDGFTAQTELEEDNLVFFSVPYDEGFKAFVDGTETKIECVDGGLMAVPVPAGKHELTFTYYPKGLKAGIAVSLLTAAAMIVLQIVRHRHTNVLAKRNNK